MINERTAFYTRYDEASRLYRGISRLEFARTQELVLRHFPAISSAVVYDIGGACGAYSFWLTGMGHQVHLLDITPKHIEQAHAYERESGIALASAVVGDARSLPFSSASADVVFLMRPLYHLQDCAQRELAIAEALRVLKPSGLLCAAAIGRHAALLDGFVSGFITDPGLFDIMQAELRDGCHHCPPGSPYFTTSYFHLLEELRAEAKQAGVQVIDIYAVESFGAMLPDFEAQWDSHAYRELLLQSIRLVETDPSLMGISPHLLLVGRKA